MDGGGRDDKTKLLIFSGQPPKGKIEYGDVHMFADWPGNCGQNKSVAKHR